MNIINFFENEHQAMLMEKISQCDWSAARFLVELLQKGTFRETLGGWGELYLLMDGENLVSFATSSGQDAVRDESLTPWIGFVYARYIDPDFFQNIPMTMTERLTMASRPKQPKYARNKNILVIGGSGSGKTSFFCKPSLLQAHSSYVVTDPKGTLLRDLMEYDELELDTLGDEKTALFVILSDTDSTFNFVAALMYSQLFNLLCDKADDFYGGRLPVHVRLILDEFANIGQIPNFDKLIATIRSREISASIILQSQSQLKTIYKDAADGYIKDPDNPKHWIIEEEAASTVRRIFSMTLDGLGPEQIAAQLERDGVLTPRAYWQQRGVKRPGKGDLDRPTKWGKTTIMQMLSIQEYCGDILNFKTYSKSYKNKKRIDNDRENWLVFKDVHEPIIDRVIWEQIQEKRGKIRKRKPKDGERNIFSGLLVCADCGHNLNYHFNQGNHDIKYFNCSNYRGNRGTCSSTHYIRVDFLEQVVLGEIKRLTKYAVHYEDQFLEAVMGSSQKSAEAEHKRKQKELAAAQARDNELDVLFERIYEDNLAGKLSDERFAKMSQRYEAEQAELAEKMKLLHHEIDKLSSNSISTDLFLSTVRKYTRAKKLTPRMLNELINRIEVHQAEKINGEWVQRLTIHYNCIGALFIPDTEPLPVPNVTVNTRRGVYVTYEPAQNE